MAGKDNLIGKGLESRTTEEVRAIASKGGKASVKARRERKKLKEELKIMLSLPDVQERICGALINAAQNGDVKAFRTIRDTIGENPEYGDDAKITAVSISNEEAEKRLRFLWGEDYEKKMAKFLEKPKPEEVIETEYIVVEDE